MKFDHLMAIVGEEPMFETGLLLAGDVDPRNLRRQLSRWTSAGKLIQLRRGLYALAGPWHKHSPHPFLVANRLVLGSYVSGVSALAFAGVIPEHVAEVTSCGGVRPCTYRTPFGRFSFRHVKRRLRFGYRLADVGTGERAFVAQPEKALIDMVHLQPGADDPRYLEQIRLNFDVLDLGLIESFARKTASPKLLRVAAIIRELTRKQAAYTPL